MRRNRRPLHSGQRENNSGDGAFGPGVRKARELEVDSKQ